MLTLKCKSLLHNLHQKKYHYFNDEDISRVVINMDEKEWYALTNSKKLLQFYLDNPNSGIPYNKSLLNDEAMMGHYDNLYYHIAKNRSRMLTLSPLIFENIHYTGEIKRMDRKAQVENLIKYYQSAYSSEDFEERSRYKKNDEVKLSQYPLAWVVGVFYVAWVVLLLSVKTISIWQALTAITLGAPFFIASVVIFMVAINFIIVLLYDLGLESLNFVLLLQHRRSEYGKLEKRQAKHLAARLAPSKNL